MNLAHYLGSGIIAPSIYIENKNDDIQDRFKNHLLLSTSMFTIETNCAIEIALDNDEEATKKISENFHLFNMPLPISRIKNIYFSSNEQKIRTAQNISFGDAFIPERILKVSQEESIQTTELDNLKNQYFDKNWSEYLKRYDQILGGFSAMKISKEHNQNYPTHYFSTLGNVNNLFTNILKQQNIGIEDSFQFAFTDEGKFKDFHNTIYSEIDYNEVERYATNDNVRLEIKNGLIQIDKIPENKLTYYVAILESYGKGKRKQVDSFISDLISGKFVEKKKEGLSLIFGLNKGYKAFRNKYKTSNFEVDIKFHLDSKLDYYIIESIYQNVFNSLDSISSFKFIDDLSLEAKNEEIKNSKYITYQMIDKTIILEERIATPFEKILEKIADKISKWFPFDVKKSEIEILFKDDIESFKNLIETNLENKYKNKLEQNRVVLEQLNTTIFEKDKKINQLEIQLKEKVQSKNEKPINTYKLYKPDSKNNSVEENNASVIDVNEDYSKENLERLSMTLLKKTAKELKIQKYSTYKNNTELITEILKLKAKQ